MSLHPQPFGAVPAETARVARAAFPQGNRYMRMHDEIGVIYEDEAFVPLFSHRGQPVEAPWRLALVTTSKDYDVDLCGPPRANCHWQAQAATGFAASDFTLDW